MSKLCITVMHFGLFLTMLLFIGLFENSCFFFIVFLIDQIHSVNWLIKIAFVAFLLFLFFILNPSISIHCYCVEKSEQFINSV